MAEVKAVDARTLTITPWDSTTLRSIEKAINESDLGINPQNDGKVIRLPVPPLSAERRTQLSKQVKTRAEEGKVSIRNVRRDGNEAAKKAQKGGEITEDDLKNLLDKIQKMTDAAIKDIDVLAADKEKELMTV
jgi:ribosome recycling factor